MSLKKYWRGWVNLKKYKSEGKSVEVTVNSKEKTLKTFVWISSTNSASGSDFLYLKYTVLPGSDVMMS